MNFTDPIKLLRVRKISISFYFFLFKFQKLKKDLKRFEKL